MAPLSQPPPSSIAARLDDSVFAVRRRVAARPRVAIVLGSGLGAFGDTLDGLEKIAYRDVPHMPSPAVEGHAGSFCFGAVGGTPVVCMQGRVHLYEGHPMDRVVQGVRTMARLGAGFVLIANAAGGLDATWSHGDPGPSQPDGTLTPRRRERRRAGPTVPGHDVGVRSGAPRVASRRGARRRGSAPRGRICGHARPPVRDA